MKIIPKAEIIRRLNKIYAKIPSFICYHCQQCSAPIMWSKPEEINIRNYLTIHHIEYITWSDEEFKSYQMNCPYLNNNRCSIYPVRPLVCRLQGLVGELYCPNNTKIVLSKEQYTLLIKELNDLTRDIGGTGEFFGTRKELGTTCFMIKKAK